MRDEALLWGSPRFEGNPGEGRPSPSPEVLPFRYGAVVALEMSLLPQLAGQSPSGQGAGNT